MRVAFGLAALIASVVAGLTAGPGSSAVAGCQIKSFAALPVSVVNNKFLVDVAIDGKPVKLIFDSGAFGTTLFGEAAEKIGLGAQTTAGNIFGVGGVSGERVRRVATLQIGPITRSNTAVVVAVGGRTLDGAAGLMGRDQFENFDVEFDIVHRKIRFLQMQGCSDAQMPYWATKAYSEAPLIALPEELSPDYRMTIALNGKPTEVMVDSGAGETIVSTAAANNAGVYDPDFRPLGAGSGIGVHTVRVSTANFKTVSIDDEVVHNVELEVADIFHYNTEYKTGSLIDTQNMDLPQGLLGADFLMSHRVLLSRRHRAMYFTYEGGKVFGPGAGPAPGASAADAEATAAPPSHP